MDDLRIAFLYPSVELGAYWLPVLNEFRKICSQTIFYTGYLWPGFDPEAPGASAIQVVGKTRFVEATKTETGYSRGFYKVSPNIVGYLLRYRPHVIISSAFSIWTLFALLFKPLGRWRVIVIWDGSSPNVDFRDSKARLFLRRAIAHFTDAFISNSCAGKDYLLEFVRAKESSTFTRPYLVPDPKALEQRLEDTEPSIPQQQRPVFLYVGRIAQRKGINNLLKACAILQSQGYCHYTLMIVGEGPQCEELEGFCKSHNLEDCINWVGWISYSNLGTYFRNADVFVFPTLEDIWGMVVPEAMAFSKPILCSKEAGAAEMVIEGENGYVFDPHNPEALAEVMRYFIDKPDLIVSMGQKSQQLISQHTPEAAAKLFAEVTSYVLKK